MKLKLALALALMGAGTAHASNYALEEIPQAIPAADAAKLKTAGIATTFALLEKGAEAPATVCPMHDGLPQFGLKLPKPSLQCSAAFRRANVRRQKLGTPKGDGVAFAFRDGMTVRASGPKKMRTGEMPCSTFSTGRPL